MYMKEENRPIVVLIPQIGVDGKFPRIQIPYIIEAESDAISSHFWDDLRRLRQKVGCYNCPANKQYCGRWSKPPVTEKSDDGGHFGETINPDRYDPTIEGIIGICLSCTMGGYYLNEGGDRNKLPCGGVGGRSIELPLLAGAKLE